MMGNFPNASRYVSNKEIDVLMIPIGGRVMHNTMGETEAFEAVKVLNPRLVIMSSNLQKD